MSGKRLSTDEQYIEDSAKLLKFIEEREEYVQMLKIATPVKIPLIRKAIAKYDELIQGVETRMELLVELKEMEAKIDEDYENADLMSKEIEPELLAYLEKNNPEAYEKLKAELEEIDARFPDEEDE